MPLDPGSVFEQGRRVNPGYGVPSDLKPAALSVQAEQFIIGRSLQRQMVPHTL